MHGFHPRSEMLITPQRLMDLPGADMNDFLSDISLSRKPRDLYFAYNYLNDDNSVTTLWRSDPNLRYTHIKEYLLNGTIPPWYLGSPIVDDHGITHSPLTREAFEEMARNFYIDDTGLVVESGSECLLRTERRLLLHEFIALPSYIRDSTTLQPARVLRFIELKTSVWFPDGRRRLRHYMNLHQGYLSQSMQDLTDYRKRIHTLARIFRH